jgi:hypothetical protein
MLSFMEFVLRVIFCTPPPEGIDNTDVTRQQRALRILSLSFDVLDLVDSILDVVEGIRLLTTSNTIQGILLLSGIALARAIASKGKPAPNFSSLSVTRECPLSTVDSTTPLCREVSLVKRRPTLGPILSRC